MLNEKSHLYLRCAEVPRVPWLWYIKPNSTPSIKRNIVLQPKPILQHTVIPTLDSPPPSPTKPIQTSSKLIIHYSNHITS